MNLGKKNQKAGTIPGTPLSESSPKSLSLTGMIDRVLRTALAVVVAILYFAGQLTGAAAVILGVLAVIFLATSSVGFCPAYTLLGISTLKGEAHEEGHHGEAHKGAH